VPLRWLTIIVPLTDWHVPLWLEAARWLIEPNEIGTLPERQMLVLADVAALLLVRVKPYYRIRRLAGAGESAISEAAIGRSSTAAHEALATAYPSIWHWELITRLARSLSRDFARLRHSLIRAWGLASLVPYRKPGSFLYI
jgi:hypothetical protein